MDVRIVGVDCAVDPSRVGLALGLKTGNRRTRIVEAKMASGRCSLAETLAGLVNSRGPALLALDAPLGWPEALAGLLPGHRAGRALWESAENLFSRCTDRFVRKALGKAPLEVGADRIARTGWATLKMIEELERIVGSTVDLAWDRCLPARGIQAIEVYPAATLRAHRFTAGGYRKAGQENVREEILSAVKRALDLECDISAAIRHTDVLDAVLCVLAADDFLRGECIPPEPGFPVRKEGWIWVKRPSTDKA